MDRFLPAIKIMDYVKASYICKREDHKLEKNKNPDNR